MDCATALAVFYAMLIILIYIAGFALFIICVVTTADDQEVKIFGILALVTGLLFPWWLAFMMQACFFGPAQNVMNTALFAVRF